MVDYETLPLRNDFHLNEHLHQNNNNKQSQSPSTVLSKSSSPATTTTTTTTKSSRVTSLDVFRGLCVFLMMFVDYGGSIFPVLAHSPWNGVHLADFVMPFFLFVAGVALAIVYKKVPNRIEASRKAVTRGFHLFILGVFLQGGFLHGAKTLTYGVDVDRIRWMGILQRISIAYVITALSEIWLPCQKLKSPAIFRRYVLQWALAAVLCCIYVVLLYGVRVPDWEFSVSSSNSSLPISNGTDIHHVKCDVRGDLGPACNSAALIDRYVLGVDHLYAKPAYKNLKECNMTSGQVSDDSPTWCHAPYDPEGILGSLTAAVICILGLQFGHVLVQFQEHKERLCFWSIFSFGSLVLGFFIACLGMPLNKSLFTVSYSLVTSAAAGITFCLLYVLVDVYGYRRVTYILEWMGVHALSIFILLTSNIAIIVIQGFYVKDPSNNIIHGIISCFVRQ